jgi:16S rRNA (adenine1518-N6/adenine1519-N6)-dimethyltransferase
VRELVRAAFAHRRKALPRSLELAGAAHLESARAALRALGLREDARAESLTPTQFAALADKLAGAGAD